VNSRAAKPSLAMVANGGSLDPFFADEDRAQRNTVALRDVDYLIEASFRMSDRAGPSDNLQKFVEIFERRLDKGQHFHQPYLGCREFVAEILSADGAPPAVDDSRDLGLMLWDIVFGPTGNRAVFFHAKLERGVLSVPESPDGKEAG
jgi:CRISPR-associated protein Cas5d